MDDTLTPLTPLTPGRFEALCGAVPTTPFASQGRAVASLDGFDLDDDATLMHGLGELLQPAAGPAEGSAGADSVAPDASNSYTFADCSDAEVAAMLDDALLADLLAAGSTQPAVATVPAPAPTAHASSYPYADATCNSTAVGILPMAVDETWVELSAGSDDDGSLDGSLDSSSAAATPSSGRASSAAMDDGSAKPFAKRARAHMAEELTEEEVVLLRREGFAMPADRRLTKDEERQLKKLRRKIKNKMSAQDSRKRKKQERDTLEGRINEFKSRNVQLEEKVTTLEKNNRALSHQLREMRMRLAQLLPKGATVGTALMLLGACFTVFTNPGALHGNGSDLAAHEYGGAEASTGFCASGDGAACGNGFSPVAFRARTLLAVDDDDEEEERNTSERTVPSGRGSRAERWFHHAVPTQAQQQQDKQGQDVGVVDAERWRELRSLTTSLAELSQPQNKANETGGPTAAGADAAALAAPFSRARLMAPVATRASGQGPAAGKASNVIAA